MNTRRPARVRTRVAFEDATATSSSASPRSQTSSTPTATSGRSIGAASAPVPSFAFQEIDLTGFAALLAPQCRMLRDDVTEALSHAHSSLTRLATDWRELLFPAHRCPVRRRLRPDCRFRAATRAQHRCRVNHDLQILSDGPAFGGRAGRVVRDHAGGFPVAGQHDFRGGRAARRQFGREPDPATVRRHARRDAGGAGGGGEAALNL